MWTVQVTSGLEPLAFNNTKTAYYVGLIGILLFKSIQKQTKNLSHLYFTSHRDYKNQITKPEPEMFFSVRAKPSVLLSLRWRVQSTAQNIEPNQKIRKVHSDN